MLGGGAGQILIGRPDDPHIDRDRPRCADARHLAIFDHAQQPFLRRHRKRAEFVEEQRAAIGLLESPRPRAGGAGERARLMAEKLGLDQRFGQRRAVHRHQRPVPAGGKMVETLGDQFLAGAALADHQHRPVEQRRPPRLLDRVEKGGRLADDGVTIHSATY